MADKTDKTDKIGKTREGRAVDEVEDVLTLEYSWGSQAQLQRALHNGKLPKEFGEEEKIQYIKDQTLAVISELNEAMMEVGWKPWASSRHINRNAYVGELRDAWQHLMNLMMVAGVEPRELSTLLYQKHIVNWRRIMDGYDGVANKCPFCHRSYDDPAVLCTPEMCVENP